MSTIPSLTLAAMPLLWSVDKPEPDEVAEPLEGPAPGVAGSGVAGSGVVGKGVGVTTAAPSVGRARWVLMRPPTATNPAIRARAAAAATRRMLVGRFG